MGPCLACNVLYEGKMCILPLIEVEKGPGTFISLELVNIDDDNQELPLCKRNKCTEFL